MLAAHANAGSFLESPAPEIDATLIRPATERPGDTIGRYKLIEQIGEGGMGIVFMAQQAEPVKRTVAVKIIKPGMDSKAVLARFEAERQALAMMDHPNIARVLDAGSTDSGRPFFVMELVKGVPITQYCDQRRLTPRERLELFLPVCQAIQHAHQKGVIHRDIKPSNVLVALYDDKPVPKVIDFGVAKATGQALTEKTLLTGVRGPGGHTGIHVARAGRAEQPGHRHPQRRLFAGRLVVRAIDGQHARGPQVAGRGRALGGLADRAGGRGPAAQREAEQFRGLAEHRGQPQPGTGQAHEAAARANSTGCC